MKSDYKEYDLHDMRIFADADFATDVCSIDLSALCQMRNDALFSVLPKDRADEQTNLLRRLNAQVRTKRLYNTELCDYRYGYRKYREKMVVHNVIFSKSYILILVYDPSRNCVATLYDRNSPVGLLFLDKLQCFASNEVDDDTIVNNIKVEWLKLSNEEILTITAIVLPLL